MTKQAEIGAGDLEFELDGEKLVLKPSLEACIALTGAPGGLYGPGSVVERVLKCDLDTIVFVVRCGLNVPNSLPLVKEIQGKVYRTGLIEMRGVCSEFVGIVANGGRKAPVDGDGEGEGEGASGEVGNATAASA